jgi:hypothetical protein
MKENLHRDYLPYKVVERAQSSLISGIILCMRFTKRNNLSLFEKIRTFLLIPKHKDIYFWLPYKRIVEASTKYGVVGPASRFPYANQWFEVKQDSEIYKQGLLKFIFHREKLYKAKNELRLTEPFLASELITLTRKAVIRELDARVFKKAKQRRKLKMSSKSKI